MLVNEADPVSFEVAPEKTPRVQFSREGERLDYWTVAGATQKDALRRLTALTGRAPLPPAWSFGLWMTTSFTTQHDEATATHFIDEMKCRDLPRVRDAGWPGPGPVRPGSAAEIAHAPTAS